MTWTVGDVIRKLRSTFDWTLEDLEVEAGVDLQTIHRIEIGDTKEPKRPTLTKISQAFGLTSRQLEDAVPPELDLPIIVRKPTLNVKAQAKHITASARRLHRRG